MAFDRAVLERAIEFSFEQVGDPFDPQDGPEVHRTIVAVVSAQGIIDNGGLAYLFEDDFTLGTPPYGDIAAAYRRVGALDAAQTLEDAVRLLFPFREPHQHKAKRNAVLDAQRGNPASDLERLSRQICGDASVEEALAAYIRANAAAFPPALRFHH